MKQKLRRKKVEVIVLTLETLVFSLLYISLVASVMLSVYVKLASHVLAIREREWQYTYKELFTYIARLK